jgi:transposase InsO family protein
MFVAKYIDYLWHMDLHEIHVRDETTGATSTIYVVAFLDDASRFIMHYRLIHDMRSDTCAAVLAEALVMWDAPWVLGSDNGGEFTGAALTSILQQYGVSHWRTTGKWRVPRAPIPRNKTGKWSVSGEVSKVSEKRASLKS